MADDTSLFATPLEAPACFALCVAILVAHFHAWNHRVAPAAHALSHERARQGEVWRLATVLFVHSSWVHAAPGALALWAVGSVQERARGSVAFLAASAGMALLAHAAALALMDTCVRRVRQHTLVLRQLYFMGCNVLVSAWLFAGLAPALFASPPPAASAASPGAEGPAGAAGGGAVGASSSPTEQDVSRAMLGELVVMSVLAFLAVANMVGGSLSVFVAVMGGIVGVLVGLEVGGVQAQTAFFLWLSFVYALVATIAYLRTSVFRDTMSALHTDRASAAAVAAAGAVAPALDAPLALAYPPPVPRVVVRVPEVCQRLVLESRRRFFRSGRRADDDDGATSAVGAASGSHVRPAPRAVTGAVLSAADARFAAAAAAGNDDDDDDHEDDMDDADLENEDPGASEATSLLRSPPSRRADERRGAALGAGGGAAATAATGNGGDERGARRTDEWLAWTRSAWSIGKDLWAVRVYDDPGLLQPMLDYFRGVRREAQGGQGADEVDASDEASAEDSVDTLLRKFAQRTARTHCCEVDGAAHDSMAAAAAAAAAGAGAGLGAARDSAASLLANARAVIDGSADSLILLEPGAYGVAPRLDPWFWFGGGVPHISGAEGEAEAAMIRRAEEASREEARRRAAAAAAAAAPPA